MSIRRPSLPEGDDEQEKPSRREMSTGEHIDPAIREKVIEALARGIPKTHIQKGLGPDYYTICAIELAMLPDIEKRRQAAADEAYIGMRASFQSAIERARNGLATALDGKMFADAWRDLTAQAGAPVNVIHHFAPLAEWESLGEGKAEGPIIDQVAD